MLEKFIDKFSYDSYEDFCKGFKINVPENFNFAYDVIDEWARVEPDKKALLWVSENGDKRQFTFADIKKYSDQTASYFQQLGIGKGDMVLVILKRRYQFWFTITALHKIGAVIIPATHLLTEDDIVYRCQSASVKAVVCVGDREVLDHVRKAAPNCPTVDTYISVGPEVPDGFHDYNKGIAEAPEFHRPEQVNSNDDTMLMYFTSGTSGEPKMVAHNYLYALGHLATAYFWHNLKEDSLHLTVADTGWGKAVWGCYYGQWIVGANVFVFDFDKFQPVNLLEAIQDYHITSLCAPPTIYRFLIREKVENYDLSSLKYCTNAGEALNPSVFEAWHKLTGIKLHEAYGQTETTATLGTWNMIEPHPGSMGKPNPGYDVHIMLPDGRLAEDGEKGEIVVSVEKSKPLGLFKDYYRDPELTNKQIHDGYYHTGDMAWRDEEGYYWFVGRIDDVIKSSGYRIGPFEVENALMKHPAVVECAVTGVPDEVRGMAVKGTIVLAKEYQDNPDIEYNHEYRGKEVPAFVKDIQDFVKHITAPYKYPRVIEFVRELPKTISGKIRRVEIRERDNANGGK